MANPLGTGGTVFGKQPIGRQGVIDYCDQMNAAHPDAPYVWQAIEKPDQHGRMLLTVTPVRKSELKASSPRVTAAEVARLLPRSAA